MIYLIGGAARCGKSTLLRHVARRTGGQAVSLDLLRPAFARFAHGTPLGDRLARAPSTRTHTPDDWLDTIRDRDLAIWSGVLPILAAAEDDLVIEGNLWPDDVAGLHDHGIDHRAVWLVDTGPGHAERLTAVARNGTGSNNWQAGWPDDRLEHWARFNRHRSARLRALCDATGYPAFDVDTPSPAVDVARRLRSTQENAGACLLPAAVPRR